MMVLTFNRLGLEFCWWRNGPLSLPFLYFYFTYFLHLCPEDDHLCILGHLYIMISHHKFHMATFYKELNNGELGLELLAKILKVERYGNSHQAGSDSLLTAEIFTKMKRVFQLERKLGFYEGYLYSITSRIPRCRYLVRPIRTCAYLVSLPSGLLCRQLPVLDSCRTPNIM